MNAKTPGILQNSILQTKKETDYKQKSKLLSLKQSAVVDISQFRIYFFFDIANGPISRLLTGGHEHPKGGRQGRPF
jgi:hypothetical protein